MPPTVILRIEALTHAHLNMRYIGVGSGGGAVMPWPDHLLAVPSSLKGWCPSFSHYLALNSCQSHYLVDLLLILSSLFLLLEAHEDR